MGIRFYLERAQFASVEKTPDVKQWLASIAFLIFANFNWVLTRQRQMDLLKNVGPSPVAYVATPHSLPICTAQHCDSNRLPIQVQALLR